MQELYIGEGDDGARLLDAAVEAVEPAATEHNIGILVSDLGGGRYIVRAHPVVPAGFVRHLRGASASA